jgi:hypothetical protein
MRPPSNPPPSTPLGTGPLRRREAFLSPAGGEPVPSVAEGRECAKRARVGAPYTTPAQGLQCRCDAPYSQSPPPPPPLRQASSLTLLNLTYSAESNRQ